jgi:hypothetical protein
MRANGDITAIAFGALIYALWSKSVLTFGDISGIAFAVVFALLAEWAFTSVYRRLRRP